MMLEHRATQSTFPAVYFMCSWKHPVVPGPLRKIKADKVGPRFEVSEDRKAGDVVEAMGDHVRQQRSHGQHAQRKQHPFPRWPRA